MTLNDKYSKFERNMVVKNMSSINESSSKIEFLSSVNDGFDVSSKGNPTPNFPKESTKRQMESSRVFESPQILIVDDNIFNLATMSTMIKIKFGQEVI